MIGVEGLWRCAGLRLVKFLLAVVATALTIGCRTTTLNSVQVQFYSPAGAAVVIRGVNGDSVAEVQSRGPLGDRLEWSPDDLAVFDLRPGKYSFAYTNAAGAKDAVIYGELEIRNPQGEVTRRFCKYSFIPIKLPSDLAQQAEHRFPSRDLSYTIGLEGREFDHIKQGDLITKVYLVADLERVKQEYDVDYQWEISELDRYLIVLGDREVYLENRYQDERRRALQRAPDMNIEDKIAHKRFDVFGIEEKYIKLSKKRQELIAEREVIMTQRKRLEDERERRKALLRSLKIVHREGALVLATPDLQLPYADAVSQASDLGEVVAVVRVGGRHRYWAMDLLAAREDAEAQPDFDIQGEVDRDTSAAIQP